jgi:carboxymethylenebutenolidase
MPDYLIKPKSNTGKCLLVLHAWWGLNDFFQDFCDRLAAEGFVVLAPDLYDGKIAATIPEAEKLRSSLKGPKVEAHLLEAIQTLQSACRHGEGIGVVGFSLGGRWALDLAERHGDPIRAAVIFYGSRGGEYTSAHAAFQFHLAEQDDYVAASGTKKLQKALKAAGKEAEFHTYPGTRHWFFESDRPEYDATAATLAWERMVEFLTNHI